MGMFCLTHFLALGLKILGSMLDLMSSGSWLNSAELRQKTLLLAIVRFDWILMVLICLFGTNWSSSLVLNFSFLARYWGCCAAIDFWAVTRVKYAVSCWIDRSPVVWVSCRVDVPNGRLVFIRITLFWRTCNFLLSPRIKAENRLFSWSWLGISQTW